MSERDPDVDTDVVVVGGGNAGFCAAHASRESGARVLVLEKGPPEEAGGNSFYTAGAFRIVHDGADGEQRLRELVDDKITQDRLADTVLEPYTAEQFTEDMQRLTEGHCDPAMTRILVEDSAEIVAWLAGHGIRWRLMYERQSYLSGGRGIEHGIEPPDLPDPESVPSVDELLRGYEDVVPHFVNALRPIDWRYTNDPAWVMRDKGEKLTYNRVWMKAEGTMPDDPVLHAAALVYSSDTTVLDSIITTHGLSWGFDRIFAVTMNHSVWLHRPVRFDEWVLYSTSSPVAADSRGLGTGHFFDRSGQLLATVVQEGIVKYFPGAKA